MGNLNYKTHKTADKVWTDESGMQIPSNRITKTEKAKERHSAKIVKEALTINKKLSDYKLMVDELNDAIYEMMLADAELKTNGKGNLTWYNFDRSIKIEKSIGAGIKFDEGLIELAKQTLDQFIKETVTTQNDAVKHLVLDAFSTARGRLDTNKILGLKRYRSKINHKTFHKGLDLIDEAIRRPDKTEYFRIWVKDDKGAYQPIRLNFSDKNLI